MQYKPFPISLIGGILLVATACSNGTTPPHRGVSPPSSSAPGSSVSASSAPTSAPVSPPPLQTAEEVEAFFQGVFLRLLEERGIEISVEAVPQDQEIRAQGESGLLTTDLLFNWTAYQAAGRHYSLSEVTESLQHSRQQVNQAFGILSELELRRLFNRMPRLFHWNANSGQLLQLLQHPSLQDLLSVDFSVALRRLADSHRQYVRMKNEFIAASGFRFQGMNRDTGQPNEGLRWDGRQLNRLIGVRDVAVFQNMTVQQCTELLQTFENNLDLILGQPRSIDRTQELRLQFERNSSRALREQLEGSGVAANQSFYRNFYRGRIEGRPEERSHSPLSVPPPRPREVPVIPVTPGFLELVQDTDHAGQCTQMTYRNREGGQACNFHAIEGVLWIARNIPEVMNRFALRDQRYFGEIRRQIMDEAILQRHQALDQGMPDHDAFLHELNRYFPEALRDRYRHFGFADPARHMMVDDLPEAFRVVDADDGVQRFTVNQFRARIRTHLLAPADAGTTRFMIVSPNGTTCSFISLNNGMAFILDSHLALVEIAEENDLIDHITNRILRGNEVEFDFYDGVVPTN